MTDREAIDVFEKQLHSAQVMLDSFYGTHPVESDSLYRSYRRRKEIAEAALSALQEREKRKSPCDLCAYNPPSSFDGKPCTMCPACAKEDAE